MTIVLEGSIFEIEPGREIGRRGSGLEFELSLIAVEASVRLRVDACERGPEVQVASAERDVRAVLCVHQLRQAIRQIGHDRQLAPFPEAVHFAKADRMSALRNLRFGSLYGSAAIESSRARVLATLGSKGCHLRSDVSIGRLSAAGSA